MEVTKKQSQLLKKHGFQWYKESTTDRVEKEFIKHIIPIQGGFIVIYKKSKLAASIAQVNTIDIPQDPSSQWIRVHWENIRDEYAVGKH